MNHSFRTGKLPLSANQKQLWVLSQLDNSDPTYNIQLVYHFLGKPDIAIFEKSIQVLFEKQHTLFSEFSQDNGVPFLCIRPKPVAIEHLDFTNFPISSRREEIMKFSGEQTRIPIDIEKDALYRLFFVKEDEKNYFLVAIIHHIIFDGFSRKLFVEELSEIYANITNRKEVLTETLEYHSYDLTSKELDSLSEEKEKKLADFWKEHLRNSTPEIKLPYDLPRKTKPTGFGEKEYFKLSIENTSRIRDLSQKNQTSVFQLMFSVLGLFFQRISGSSDICIGLPVSIRRSHNSFKTFGFFVNTIPVRLVIDDQKDFTGHLAYSADVIRKALSCSQLPFEKIVEVVKPERVPGLNPFFQICFSWINGYTSPIELNGIKGHRITVPYGVSSFDITFYMWENENNIEGEIEYNTDIFKRETITQLKNNFLTLISNIVEEENQLVKSIEIITPEEKLAITHFNSTSTNYPRNNTIVKQFEIQAQKNPDKKAVVFKEQSITYKELNEKANQLSRLLRQNGLKKNEPAGILVNKSVEMVIGILAILKAGGAYVPIDPEYPEQRMKFIIGDCKCKIILTQARFFNQNIDGVKKINLNDPESFNYDKTDPDSFNTPDDTAYIIYTSGTTGTPKGTIIPHRGVVRLVCCTNYIDFTPEDNVLQTSAIVFDASTEEIFGALLNGSTLFVIDKETVLDPYAFGEVLNKNNITIVDLASALFTQIAESNPGVFNKVKKLILGGDVISAPHVNRVRKANSGIVVLNTYGPTENSCNSTAYIIDRDFDLNIPIGKPISNSTAYIFDKNLNYAPIGVIGELYVGGDGLSKGYLNRDDLNRTSFIENPYNPGERLYKTGDLARWLRDGNIEFHGRIDNQIKIRGFRVELEEIESVISEIEDIVEAVVKPVKIEEGDYKLVAFLNVSQNTKKDPKEIENAIKAKLPPYMLPSAYKFVQEFKKNINGKIDRKLLEFDLKELEESKREQTGLLSNNEFKLLAIWQEVLKTNDIITTDNFFDLGGNSLMVLKCLNKIKEHLGLTLSFRDFITSPSINQLSSIVENTANNDKQIQLAHTSQTSNLPLTKNQKRLLLISKLNPNLASYLIHYTYQLRGVLNKELFKQSIEILLNRHQILFSKFKEIDGEPFADIEPSKLTIAFYDHSALSTLQKTENLDNLLKEDSVKPFDLHKGPLYRIFLVYNSSNEYYLRFTFHHIVFDGLSGGIFCRELGIIYNNLLAGKTPELDKLEFNQYDFAFWENNQDNVLDESNSVQFWKEKLENSSPILNFPYDYQRTENPTGKGGLVNLEIEAILSEQIKSLAKSSGSSLFSVLMSAFAVLMQKYSGDQDINIGSPIAYRPHSSLEEIIGMFVNTVVFRFQFLKGQTFQDFVKQTYSNIAATISYQNFPFERIVEIVNPERSANINPLFQVAFAWQNNLESSLTLNNIVVSEVKEKEKTSAFDITLFLWEKDGSIEGEFVYNTDILKHETIVALRTNYINLLENLVKKNDLPFDTIPAITKAEMMKFDDFNNTRTDYPREKTIIQLFEEQVNIRPDKIAISFKDDTLTYRQLNEKANQLGHYLRKLGVKKDAPVGLIAEKSIDMIVGILGILKAGGAYLPIDPEYPSERISYIVSDSSCNILLVQSKFADYDFGSAKKVNLNTIDLYCTLKENPEIISNPHDLAYIMYTSGTTGMPKGSMIPQQGVIRLIRNTNYVEISSNDRILLTGAIVFDATTFEIWGALLNGGSLFIADKNTVLDPQALGEELLKNNITTLWLTSPLFTQIAEIRTDIFKPLKYLLVGGDILSASHINKVRKDNPKLKVINGYGPTENTTFSTTFLIEKDYFNNNIPIGKPICNSTAYIFDNNLNYQPIGVIGELYVGGDGLSRGYLNRDDLNAKSFIEHPFKPGCRLYKTGDRAKWLPDGNIEFHGRIDNQIKIRGFRVELEEIELAISETDEVVETVVKPFKLQEGNYILVAFLNVTEKFSIDTKTLENRLKKRLPSYMIPSAFKIMHGFSKTINGKIDKKQLNFDLSEITNSKEKEETNLSLTEQKIAEIWSEVLKTKNFSIHDSFFNIGGNSLLTISIASKIEKAFQIDFNVRNFFSAPRISELALLVDMKVSSKNSEKTEPSSQEMSEGEI